MYNLRLNGAMTNFRLHNQQQQTMNGVAIFAVIGAAIFTLGFVWYKARTARHIRQSDARRTTAPATSPRRATLDVDSDARTCISRRSTKPPYWLVIDTETFDLVDETEGGDDGNYSPAVALSWILLDQAGEVCQEVSHVIRRAGIPTAEATALHGIDANALHAGADPRTVYADFLTAAERAHAVVAHNLNFHLGVIVQDLAALDLPSHRLYALSPLCTMRWGLAQGFKRNIKGEAAYPRLDELFAYLYFGRLTIQLRYRNKSVRDARLVAACLRAIQSQRSV